MKKIYLIVLLSIFSFKVSAQTYSSVGLTLNGYEYDTITSNQDTLKFIFSGLNAGGLGQAKLRITYAGDFGDDSEYLNAYLPDWSAVAGQTSENPQGDCYTAIDSLFFDATLINSFAPSDTFYLVTSTNVDFFCSEQRVRVELIYDYCVFGTPTYANFTIPNEITCAIYAPQTLIGVPSGGTYVGSGMNGNVFDPTNLDPGSYSITYTATDAIGCTTSKTKSIRIGNAPSSISELVCNGSNQTVSLPIDHVFSENLQFDVNLDTTNSYTFAPITSSPTTYYYAKYIQPAYYMIDTIIALDSMIIDHDQLSGDDRGGIFISDTNVYVVGDNAIARYNLDLQNGVALNVENDAIFNDLTTRKIYSFSNSSNDFPSNDLLNTFTASKIIELDADLLPTGNEVSLSQNVTIGEANFNQSLILSGFSEIIFSDINNDFYNLKITSGELTLLGQHSAIDPYNSENWISWGILGFDGIDYHAFYRKNNNSKIVDYNFETQTETLIDGVSDWNDLASFTVNEQTNRLYFHYESGTSTFGGNGETLGYTTISDSLRFLDGVISCPAKIEYTFNSINLGSDTTLCDSTGTFIVEAGFGFESYTWNGVNNNWNIYPTNTTGQIVLVVVDEANCNLTDTVFVTFDPCDASITENESFAVSIYPNPNKSSFTIDTEINKVDSIEIIDMNGKVVFEENGNNTTSMTINHQLQNGVYLVKIASGDSLNIQRIIVQ
jgi:hypothetical protein